MMKAIRALTTRIRALETAERSEVAGGHPQATDATRGAAGQSGRVIFNTDDGQLNVDDGTNWTLPDGSVT